jgi:hypothetical protein
MFLLTDVFNGMALFEYTRLFACIPHGSNVKAAEALDLPYTLKSTKEEEGAWRFALVWRLNSAKEPYG